MQAHFKKYKRVFLLFLVLNLLVVVLQLGFAYSHYTKHEWWGLGLSLFFSSFNAWCAAVQYRNLMKLKQDEKDYVWQVLSI